MKFLSKEENKLVQAILRRNWEAVISICETEQHLVNTYYEDDCCNTPLMCAMLSDAPDNVLERMLNAATKQNIEHEDKDGETILHHLAVNARVSALRRALRISRKKVNGRGNTVGRTPLHYCLVADLRYEKHRDTAMCLLEHNASLTIKDKYGDMPLGDYDSNKCREYEDSTRTEKKKEIKKLLQEIARLAPAQIVARGIDAITAFNNEIENGEITMVNSRVMFLGKEGVGKTSLVNAILGKAFNKNEPSTDGIVTTTVFQTVGEDYRKWKEQKDVDVSKLTKQIQENAIAEKVAKKLKPPESQETTSKSVPRSSTASSMKEIDETTSTRTLEERGKYHVSQSTGAVPKRRAVTSMPDGIRDKVAAKLHPQTFMNKVKVYITNIMGKEVVPSDVTSIWDYAGQVLYYITHRFYLTDGASYCVVFSLVDNLDDPALPRDLQKGSLKMTNLQMNIFWIRSIYEHAVLRYNPKRKLINKTTASLTISLVGTHKDILKGSEEDKQKQIKEKFKRIFDEIKGKEYECYVDTKNIYVVDNTSAKDKGIEELKKNLGGYTKQMAKPVPTKWFDFQSKVEEVGKKTFHMPLAEISTIAADCGISHTKLITVLDYLNDIGVILYSKTNEKLENTVITNLPKMIDILTKVITVVEPDDIKIPALRNTLDNKGIMHKDVEQYDSELLTKLWRTLDKDGILHETLLRHLWRRDIKEDAKNFEIFLEIMKMFGLLFEKKMGDGKGNRMFIVPSRMQNKNESLKVTKDIKQKVSIYVTPTDFLPDAVYSVLVIAFLELMMVKGRSEDEVKLFANRSDFHLDDDHLLSLGAVEIHKKHALKLEIVHKIHKKADGEVVISEPRPSVCMEVLDYIRHQLMTVYVTKEGIGYELHVLCDVCEPTEQHFHDLETCLKRVKVPCGGMTMDTSRFKFFFSKDIQDASLSMMDPPHIHVITDSPHGEQRPEQSEADFNQLLDVVSLWWEQYGSVNMLKVLLSEFDIQVTELQKLNKPNELFRLLMGDGLISQSNIDILAEAVILCNQRGVESAIKKKIPTFPDLSKVVIRKFSDYRRNLLEFGTVMRKDNINRIGYLYNIKVKELTDQWCLILELENKKILTAETKEKFIKTLKNSDMEVEAEALNMFHRDTSTN